MSSTQGYRISDNVAAISSGEQVVQGEQTWTNPHGNLQLHQSCNDNWKGFLTRNYWKTGSGSSSRRTMSQWNDCQPGTEGVELIYQNHWRKKRYILNNVRFAKTEDLTDAVKQKYITLLLRHHEAISNSSFETCWSRASSHDIQFKNQDPIFLKQFRIPEAQREALQKQNWIFKIDEIEKTTN